MNDVEKKRSTLQAILTGSQVYGEPDGDSDVDMVVFITPVELEILRKL